MTVVTHTGRGGLRALIPLAALLIAAAIITPLIGPTTISLSRAFDRSIPIEQNTDALIFWSARLPRVLFAVIVGAGLAAAGAVYQALLRNDLATPYTLGVSGGAAFGALLAMRLSSLLLVGASALLVPGAAFAGAALAMLVVTLLSRRPGIADRTHTLLLAGVTLNLLFSSGILIIQYLSDPHQAFSMLRWMMGGLDVSNLRLPVVLGVPIALAFIILAAHGRALNVMSIGDRTALHLGIHADRTRIVCLSAASLIAALLVAYAGPVGFVGLVVPHALRRFVGPDHRVLLPAAALGGATFLLVCDTLARTVVSPLELPVGIVTSAVGGPFFLWILMRRGR